MTSTNYHSQPVPSKKKVLIVDDMPQVRQDLRQLLELTGLIEIVAEAGDGLQAYRQAQVYSPDVVVLDLEMPAMDGFEATLRIKTHDPSIRVVILSAYGGLDEIARSQAAGADSFVMKGDRYEVLVDAILGEDASPDANNTVKGE